MWMDYSELSDKNQLEEFLMLGISRLEMAKRIGCSLACLNKALSYHNLTTKRGRRCNSCGKFSAEEQGLGFCDELGRIVGGMAFCKEWRERGFIM